MRGYDINKIYSLPVLFLFFISTVSIDFGSINSQFGINLTIIFYGIRTILTIMTYILFLSFLTHKPLNKSRYKYIIVTICILLFLIAWIFLNAFAHQTLAIDQFVKFMTSLGLYIYILMYGFFKKKILYDFHLILLIILLVNYIFYFFFPQVGVYSQSDLGVDIIKGFLNNRNSIILLALPLFLLNNFLRVSKTNNLIISFLSLLQLFLTDSTTAWAIGIVALILVTFKYFHINILIIVVVILNLSIVFLNVNNPLIQVFSSTPQEMNMLFNGRLFIWEKTIESFDFRSILLGYGMNTTELTNYLGGMVGTNGILISSPMNGILSTMYQNGLIYTVILLGLLMYIPKIINSTYKSYNILLFIPLIILASVGEDFLSFSNTQVMSMFLMIILLQFYNKEEYNCNKNRFHL